MRNGVSPSLCWTTGADHHIVRAGQVAHAFTYGVMKTGRTTFYGGAPDHMDPDDPSYGTLDGSCGCGSSRHPLQHLAAL